MNIPNRMSCQLGVTHTSGTSADRMHTPVMADQVMVVMARSLPLIIRVMIRVQAQASAETIGKNAAG